MRCSECGYDLHGLDGARCPECGHVRRRVGEWSPDRLVKWAAGAALPLPFVALGLVCIYRRSGLLPGLRATLALSGINAIALGCSLVAVGLFLHARYFWGNSRRLAPYSEMAQSGAALVFISGLVVLAFRILVRP